MANKILSYILLCTSFIAFGLGGGIEDARSGTGLIIIEVYEKDPKVDPITISTHGIHLFTVEF